jgi:SAM-dependent methyltransferase
VVVRGVETLVRPQRHIPVVAFDGSTLPFEDGSFDVALLVDVLHHTNDPLVLLREASRVAPKKILLKDHTLTGLLAWQTLRFMDSVSNERYGVALPYNYLTKEQWEEAFRLLQLRTVAWTDEIHLYPWPASLVFTRKLHFIAELTKESTGAAVSAHHG